MVLRIGTRGSKLALAQTQEIKQRIEEEYPGMKVEVSTIRTAGDKVLDSPLAKIGGKGLFVKEIENALLDKRIDLAVHSMKDVPAELPPSLILCAFPRREDPRDAFISNVCSSFEDLPKGAMVGTSSLRRASQLLHLRPDLNILPLRGNVDTRLNKLGKGEMHAIVVAAAGLGRLGLQEQITQFLPHEHFLPAIGQGALGLEVRREDQDTIKLLGFFNHELTQLSVTTERAFLKAIQGGCQVPIAAFAELEGRDLRLDAMVAELDGSIVIRKQLIGERTKAHELGTTMARSLLDAGAGGILSRIYKSAP